MLILFSQMFLNSSSFFFNTNIFCKYCCCYLFKSCCECKNNNRTVTVEEKCKFNIKHTPTEVEKLFYFILFC